MVAEYIGSNSAKRRDCHQSPPLVDPTLEQQKWQTLSQSLPILGAIDICWRTIQSHRLK